MGFLSVRFRALGSLSHTTTPDPHSYFCTFFLFLLTHCCFCFCLFFRFSSRRKTKDTWPGRAVVVVQEGRRRREGRMETLVCDGNQICSKFGLVRERRGEEEEIRSLLFSSPGLVKRRAVKQGVENKVELKEQWMGNGPMGKELDLSRLVGDVRTYRKEWLIDENSRVGGWEEKRPCLSGLQDRCRLELSLAQPEADVHWAGHRLEREKKQQEKEEKRNKVKETKKQILLKRVGKSKKYVDNRICWAREEEGWMKREKEGSSPVDKGRMLSCLPLPCSSGNGQEKEEVNQEEEGMEERKRGQFETWKMPLGDWMAPLQDWREAVRYCTNHTSALILSLFTQPPGTFQI